MNTPIEEIIHGVAVSDPYRWLEDRESAATDEWIRRQQGLCNTYFSAMQEHPALESRVRKYLDVEVIDQPAKVRELCFYRQRRGGKEQGAICVREGTAGTERVLVDSARDGRFASVGIYRISSDAHLLAYELRRGGGDRREIRILDVNSESEFPARIAPGYPRGFVFAQDGYFYAQEIDPHSPEHTVCFLSFEDKAPDRVVYQVPHTSGSRLVLAGNAHRIAALQMVPRGQETLLSLAIAEVEENPIWHDVFRERRLPYGTILYGNRIFAAIETASGRSCVVELALNGSEVRTILPERDATLRQLVIAQGRIFVSYVMKSGAMTLEVWLVTGEFERELPLPTNGTIQLLPVYDECAASVFYTFESFAVPPTIYEYRIDTSVSNIWHQQSSSDRPDFSLVREMQIASKDGTQVPLTLVSRVPSDPDTARPVIMTSYGGFGVSVTPQFSVLVSILIELGAVFAIPHIRGGGEGGKEWHDQGRARNRQASFDDFVAAAEWLCAEGLTTPGKIGIFGGSNSGLLVAAAMTQRPDLFGAVVCIAPLLDMVRYERFDQAIKWRQEYGTVDDPDDFQALYAYSPYHHILEDVDYPAAMFATGDKDDRCNPAHVRKMAARLQGRSAQRAPVIVDYSAERGHAPSMPLSVRVPALARRLAFLCHQLQITVPSGDRNEETRL
jgi:prolyl oligopeptidase